MDRYYPDQLPPCASLDPNAVNELFENVVYGDGLTGVNDDDGALRRRQEAEKRRLEMERRSQENAQKRVQAEHDRQFFNALLLSGPDRPALNPGNNPAAVQTIISRPIRIQIPFTALDRSRVPRKTRQQWLDKFCMAAENIFPGALAILEPSVILSLEQAVYQTAKSATAYIGAWVNRLHTLKLAPSLSEFITPSVKKDAVKDDSQPTDEVIEAERAPAAPVVQAMKSGKASLLGKALPFSLFGSDDEDGGDQAEESDENVASDPVNTSVTEFPSGSSDKLQLLPSKTASECTSQSNLESGEAPLGCEAIPLDPSVQNDGSPDLASGTPDRQFDESKQWTTQKVAEELKSDVPSAVGTPSTKLLTLPKKDSIEIEQVKVSQPNESDRSAPTSSDAPSGKRRRTFNPECATFVKDVVAAHLRLRFGKELSGKVVVFIQSRVVDKILSNPKWTIERLRKHKRDIDELAERYAVKVRREQQSF